MADFVNVSAATSGPTVPVAVEVIGTRDFQLVKLVGGSLLDTTPLPFSTAAPAAAEVGAVVRVAGSVAAAISGTGLVSVVPGVSVTIVGQTVAVSGPVSVTGAVSISAIAGSVSVAGASMYITNPASAASGLGVYLVGLSTTALSGVTGPVVWLGASQSVLIGAITTVSNVNTISTILGTVVISGAVSISAIAGSVSIVGASMYVTNPASAASGMGVYLVGLSTTALSGATGPVVWLGASQTVLVASTAIVTLATGGTVTLVGTVGVSVVAAISLSSLAPVTTQTSVSVSGLPVWFAAGALVAASTAFSITGTSINVVVSGPVSVSALPAVSISVSAVLGTIIAVSGVTAVSAVSSIITILGTQVVTIAQTSVSVATVPNVNTLSTILGTVPVTVVAPALAGGYWYAIVSQTTMASSTQVQSMSVAVSTGSTTLTSGWTVGSGSVLVVYELGFGWSQPAAANQVTLMLLYTATGATLSTVAPPWAYVTYTANAAATTFLTTAFQPGAALGVTSGMTNFPLPWIIPGPAVVGVGVAATSSGATVYASIFGELLPTVPALTGLLRVSLVQTSVSVLSISMVSVVSTVVTLLGTVAVTLDTARISVISTILGTQIVSVAGGSNYVTNPASAASGLGVYLVGLSTTALSGVTGPLVWLGASQSILVTALGTVPVTLATGQISVVSTVLGTAIVSVAGGSNYVTNPASAASGLGVYLVGLSTTALSGVTGPVIWLGASQSVLIGAITTVSNINTITTILGTVVVSGAVSVSAIAGSVSIVGASMYVTNPASAASGLGVYLVGLSTTALSGVTGPLVWLGASQSVLIGAITTISNVNTISTILGTQVVTVALASFTAAAPTAVSTGLIVWDLPAYSTTGTPAAAATGEMVWVINPGAAVATTIITILVNLAGVTTQTSVSVTGVPVWWQPGALIAASTALSITGTSLNVVVSGPVSISAIAGSVSILGASMYVTNPASAASGLGVYLVGLSTTALSGVTGPVVWLGASQSVLIGAITTISNVNTISTILGTVVVSGPVSISAIAGSVSIVGASMYVTNPASAASGLGVYLVGLSTTALSGVTGPQVWLGASQTVIVTATLLQVSGAVSVSAIAGSVSIVGASMYVTNPASAASGMGVYLVGLSTTALSGVTGPLVWLGASQTVQAITPLQGGYWWAVATTSAVSSSTQVLLMSVYVSTGTTYGTSGWTIGAGSALVVYELGIGWSQAAANNLMTAMLLVTTSGATLSTVATAWAQVTFSTGVALSTFLTTNFRPGGVIGLNSSVTAICFPLIIPGPAVVGLALAATSSGATVYASIRASVVGYVPIVQPVVVSGGALQGACVTTTGVSGSTGQLVWLGASQTLLSLVSVATVSQMLTVATIVTQLGTQIVSIAGGSNYVTNPASAASGLGVYLVGLSTTALSGVTGPQVWLGASQTISVPNVASIGTVTAVVGVSAVTTVLGVVAVSVSALAAVTLVNSGTVGLPVWPGVPGFTPFALTVSVTSPPQGTTLLFSIWTGRSQAVAGATQWAVPAGKTLRIVNVMCGLLSGFVGNLNANVWMNVATASASFTSGSQNTIGRIGMIGLALTTTAVSQAAVDCVHDVSPGSTIGIFWTAGTSTITIANLIYQGYLF